MRGAERKVGPFRQRCRASNCPLGALGRNDYGQATPPDGEFASVSAGNEHTCGVKLYDAVACWGQNSYGEAKPPDWEFVSVSAGGYHTCWVKRDGAVACWGQDGNYRTRPPDGAFASISAGSAHTCGVKRDGGVACWGFDIRGEPSMLRVGVGVNRVKTGNVSICDVTVQDRHKVICRGDDSYTQGGGLA